MDIEQQKKVLWKSWRKALLGKLPYIVLGWFFYPFIDRSETREEYVSGEGGWWNRQLWYMLNDDDIQANGDDWSNEKVAEKGIDTSTKWGQFKASYWFNALRNPAYNFSQSHAPENPNGSYDIVEREINEIYLNGKKVSPLKWAEYMFINDAGKVDIKGKTLSLKHSKIGETKCWFHPNNNQEILHLRWSWTKQFRFLSWDVYRTVQLGTWTDKYDINIKHHLELREDSVIAFMRNLYRKVFTRKTK